MWLWALATAAWAGCPVVPSADGVSLMLGRITVPLSAEGSESIVGDALPPVDGAPVGGPMWEELVRWSAGGGTVGIRASDPLLEAPDGGVEAWFAARSGGEVDRHELPDGGTMYASDRSGGGQWTRTAVAVLPDTSVLPVTATLAGGAAEDAGCRDVVAAALAGIAQGGRPRDLGGYRTPVELHAGGTLELDVPPKLALHVDLTPDEVRYSVREWRPIGGGEPPGVTFIASRAAGPRPDADGKKAGASRVLGSGVAWRQVADDLEVGVLKSALLGRPKRWLRIEVRDPSDVRRGALRRIAEDAVLDEDALMTMP